MSPGGGHVPAYDFNEDKPAGTDYVYEIDDWVISNQQHFDNNLAIEHYSPSNDPDGSEDDYGRHDFITLKEQGAKPDLLSSTDRHAFYAKADGMYVETDGGDEVLVVEFDTPAVAAFPADTVMAFGQNAAPTGWTRLAAGDTLYDSGSDNAMFCFAKSGNVAAGGSVNPKAPGTTHTHTGPSHAHTMGTHTHTGPSHTHTMGTHNHQWYIDSGGTWAIKVTSGATTSSYNSDGTLRGINEDPLNDSYYTSKVDPGDTNASGTGNTGATDPGDTNAGGTGNTGASSTGIQPYYIEMILAKKD